jgi:formamidopyrimidine-DNA glycosylase
MPELPDITIYLEALSRRLLGQPLRSITLKNPFILRTVEPPIKTLEGRAVRALGRMGKRIIFDFGDELFLVVHLMIAGRFKWVARESKGPGRITLAALDFPAGRLLLTEAGTMRRAALHLVQGAASLQAFERGGLEVLTATVSAFRDRIRSENHTLKRTLTDPRLFSGIGNAYSDEILHAAKLSPLALTSRLADEDIEALRRACRETLTLWTERLRGETGDGFPERVSAFREGMAVHGRFGLPCPVCGSPVQRIRYADNETNYCARCQTGGRLLADRAMSRLLKGDWPRSLDELE